MRPFIALVSLAACVAGPDHATRAQAIIGGQTTTHDEFPTVVALIEPEDWGCTGTLVHKDWVLSAAHCVEGLTPATLTIRLDDANLDDTNAGTEVAVAEIHAMSEWVDPIWDNDVALIKLAKSVTDREPTAIERRVVAPGTTVTAVGYGDSDIDGNGGGILRKLRSTTIDCASTNDSSLSGTNLVCFDPTSGRASCDGDSGGPAFVTVDGKLRIAGINSGNTGDTCTEGWELYTAVAGELPFIDRFLPSSLDPADDSSDENDPDPGNAGGGCQVGGSSGIAAIALALVLLRRRRTSRQSRRLEWRSGR